VNVSEEQRAGIDRRCGEDRRKAHDVDYFLNGGVERRSWKERRAPGEWREGWVRVSEWSSMFVGSMGSNRKELLIERRKHKRFQAEEGAIAVLRPRRPHSPILGQIIDINRGGLAFCYVATEKLPNGPYELLIFLADSSCHLDKIPCKTISDFERADEVPFSSITMMRRGVQFGDMTHNQISQLEHFIQNHTIAEV
jgi:hypothetical protein